MGTVHRCPFKAFYLIVGLLAAIASPGAAETEPLQASWSSLSYVLYDDGAQPTLRLPEGEEVELPLPAGGKFSSLAALHDGWIAVGDFDARDGAHRLFVVRGEGTTFELQNPPHNQRKLTRQDAVLLSENGELVGLAWLEGDTRQSLDVRYSEWNGSRWRSPKRAAPRARGSQLALSGTVLADGSWLLAWSAFDGQDDEILWALRRDREWHGPRQLGGDNAVPDIAPAVAACGEGAVAAWSRYDGSDYRLMLTHFDGDAWQAEAMLPGAGSLYPVFHAPAALPGAAASGPSLLFREVSVGGWAAIALDRDGAMIGQASVGDSPAERPVLETQGAELRLSWPQQRQGRNLSWQAVAVDGKTVSTSGPSPGNPLP